MLLAGRAGLGARKSVEHVIMTSMTDQSIDDEFEILPIEIPENMHYFLELVAEIDRQICSCVMVGQRGIEPKRHSFEHLLYRQPQSPACS